ncbi:cytosine deaminase [Longilinea arvoryzae]|uniref:Cytosine deaminase n=2 Tax=Longilinea arvoryzae TaxID=360412 RepID=A0A0S7B9D4_9CHLR|nr:cytosine deaminase [Longilinea arvoryzae]
MIKQDVDVLIEGKRIVAVGRELTIPAKVDLIDASGCAVLPGLINTHTHLYQNFLKGIAGGIPLVPWCNEILFPTVGVLRDAVKENRRIPYLWTALSAIEMIKGGTTCCIDMDVTYEETLQAWREIGFRGVLAYTLTNRWVPAELRASEIEMRQKVLDFISEYHRPDGLTQVFMAPSTLFLCDDDLMSWVGEQSEKLHLGVQIHISETAGEVEDSIRETGLRPVERLEKLGLLNDRLSAVHCCHINAKEIDLLARTGANTVHCPKSNMKLADGIAPVTELKACGVPVAVATDGAASNDLLDMWEEMRAAVLLARVSRNDAAALTPADALQMATVDAARAARIDAGEIIPGKLADLILLDLNKAHLQPFHTEDVANMLVFCARSEDVRDTIIHGKVVMRNRRITTIDEEEILREAVEVERELFSQRKNYQFVSSEK